MQNTSKACTLDYIGKKKGQNRIHDDVITWKRFPRYKPSVWWESIQRVSSKERWSFLWCAPENDWTNGIVAGDFRRHDVHVTSLQCNMKNHFGDSLKFYPPQAQVFIWINSFRHSCRCTKYSQIPDTSGSKFQNLNVFHLVLQLPLQSLWKPGSLDDIIKWKHFARYWPFITSGHRWIPLTKSTDAGRCCFLWSAPKQTIE